MRVSKLHFATIAAVCFASVRAEGPGPVSKKWVRKQIEASREECDETLSELRRTDDALLASLEALRRTNSDLAAQVADLAQAVSDLRDGCCRTEQTAVPSGAPSVAETAGCVGTGLARIQPDETFDGFGSGVAMYGDTMAVGADDGFDERGVNTGAVYVYSATGPGEWTQVDKLLADDGREYDDFGGAVDLFEDTMVVGSNGMFLPGAVYIFTYRSGRWSQSQKILPDDSAVDDLFGQSVAMFADTIVVSAKWNAERGYRSGAAYVLTRKKTNDGVQEEWVQSQKLTADDAAVQDNFGSSVAIDGDTIVVGAYNDDDKGQESGSAYIFKRNKKGLWKQSRKLVAPDGEYNDWFGNCVAASGDTVVVCNNFDDDRADASGSVYVFERDGDGGWGQTQKIVPEDGGQRDYFGNSVALVGDRLLVGAYNDDDLGSVYVFYRDGSGSWVPDKKLYAPDKLEKDFFGKEIAIFGNNIAISATGRDGFTGALFVAELC